MSGLTEVARVPIATQAGEFDVRAFEGPSGFVHLLMARGDLEDGRSVLARVHSECLTGDALGSLRCDCGLQLRFALRAIAAEGRGVLVYATGHEGRGIGLLNKLRAYMLQDGGADTVDANHLLGFQTDARDYTESAACLRAVGVRSVRLLTNNPAKADALRMAGVAIDEVVPLPTAVHARNMEYLRTKRLRMGHDESFGEELGDGIGPAIDVRPLLGTLRPHDRRPHVVLKYAQTLDGRIATVTGDSKWISGAEERRVSHALRAACDAVMVGVGTVLRDDPQLTVRLVPGASPVRVVLDSTLRTPRGARVLDGDPSTLILTTEWSHPEDRLALRARGAGVRVVRTGPRGVDLTEALGTLRASGIRSLLVEGGAGVITSLLAEGHVDRVVVGVAPRILGSGTEAVGDLRTDRVSEGVRLSNRSVHTAGDDVLIAADVEPADVAEPAEAGGPARAGA
jgi:GTP cyclohydrolase II